MNHVDKTAPTTLSIMALFALASCAKAPEMEPQFLPVSGAVSAPPQNCKAVASVNSPWTFWRFSRQKAEEVALETLKEVASAKGGNYVRYEALNWHKVERDAAQASAHGTAFKCEVAAPVVSVPIASAAPASAPPGGAQPALQLRCMTDAGLTTCATPAAAKP